MIILNNVELHVTLFPDQTSQVWKTNLLEHNKVIWEYESEKEVIHIFQLLHLIKERDLELDLHIPYFPYARQDKSIGENSCFALDTFCTIVNTLINPNKTRIFTFDIHNPRHIKLPKVLVNIKPTFSKFLHNYDVVIFPDISAKARYKVLNTDTITFHKKRDLNTGKLSYYQSTFDVQGRKALVIDDICDGGATFIELAKLLTNYTILDLYVSHGIFSKGLTCLKEAGYRKVFVKFNEVKI